MAVDSTEDREGVGHCGVSFMFGGQQYDETLYWGVRFVFGGQQYDETLYWG